MAMEMFLTGLVFCEAPLDGYSLSMMTSSRAVKPLVSCGWMKPAAAAPKADDAYTGKKPGFYGETTTQRRAGYELAFDGLNCFDTVVMHQAKMIGSL
ncbi:hypothetical protein CFC21_054994 [Triticum aestivum]|uniref:Uncharacterized protein n=2 Tax=Triticum aestivum TaxID=4565 RepID=A0A9R1GFL9_WHEAT|nr:hypothetical protein CFC21_054994 [Triticum aestivum]